MTAKLPRVHRASGRPRTMVYALVGVAVLLLAVVGVLLFNGGLFSDQPASSAERDYLLLLDGLKKNPEDPAVLMTLAEAEFELDKTADAFKHAELAVKFAEEQAGFRLRYAVLLVRDGQIEKAQGLVEEEIALKDPNDAEAYFLLAQIHRELGDLEAAKDAASKGLALEPTAADMRILYGDILVELGKKELATEQYRQALRFLPGDQRAIDGLKALGVEPPASTETTSPHDAAPQ